MDDPQAALPIVRLAPAGDAADELMKCGNPLWQSGLFYLSGSQRHLDIGSNTGVPLKGLDPSCLTCIEKYAPAAEKLREAGYTVLEGDARELVEELSRRGERFDRVTMFDFIEHLPRADGEKLLEAVERFAQREIILFVPIENDRLVESAEYKGFMQGLYDTIPEDQHELQSHRCYWSPEDFSSRGYHIFTLDNYHIPGFHAFFAVKYPSPADAEEAVARLEEARARLARARSTDAGRADGSEAAAYGVLGRGSQVVDPVIITNPDRILIGNDVLIRPGARLEAIKEYGGASYDPILVIEDGAAIELSVHIGAANFVRIGKKAMIAGRVSILDHDHSYRDPTRPPIDQPLSVGKVVIDDGTWLGENVVVCKEVHIGRNAVIGANSVVTRDVPAFSVAVGNPARVVKRLNRATGEWERVGKGAVQDSDQDEMRAQELYEQAQRLIASAEHEKAAEALERLLQLDSCHASAHNDLGVLCFQDGEKDRALMHLEQAARLDPADLSARKNLADVCLDLGRFEEAVDTYEAILAERPDDVEALVTAGHLCSQAGSVEQASVFYLRALDVEPENSAAAESLQALFGEASRPGSDQHLKAEASGVAIIIPVHNNLKLTQACLHSILENTHCPDYRVIVVDNASSDGTAQYLRELESEKVSVIHNSENLGFGEACNAGAQAASAKYLVFLNNDTQVEPGWLESLVEFAEKTPTVGAVGAKLVYPDGRLQEAGCIIFSDGSGWNYGRGLDPKDPRFNFVREVDYCSAAALLVRHDLWDSIGGFDRRYAPAYYEDADLCFQIRERGYKVYCQPKSVVVHYEGQTAGRSLEAGYKKHQLTNRPKFIEKWSSELPRQHRNSPANVVKASNRQAQRSILVADAFLPFFDRASGSLRSFQLLKLLRELGFHVTFIARNPSLEERYRPLLEDLGIEVYAGDVEALKAVGCTLFGTEPINYEALLRERRFDYGLLTFWSVAEHYLPMLRRLSPETNVIVDSVDIHFIREARQAELAGGDELRARVRSNKKRELAVYRKADRLWVVSEGDKEAVAGLVGDVPVDVVPNIHVPVTEAKRFEATSDLLFVGNFKHPPNEDAIMYFCGETLPLIQRELPDVKLYIVGNSPPPSVQALASEHVIVTGYVEDLAPYLLRARLSVNPLRYGAGIKGKVGEALSWGLPVVTTSVGAEGMGLAHEQDVLIADTPEDFCAQVVRAYRDQQLWESLSENGRAKADQWSPEALKVRLQAMFPEAEPAEPESLVSIVVLACNQLPYTRACLEGVLEHTTVPYELIVVDNGSTDGTDQYLAGFARQWRESRQRGRQEAGFCKAVKIVRHERNLGYSAGNNAGIAAAGGDYVVLLNNDVVVTPGWLERLLAPTEENLRVGLVGPVTNVVSGLQRVSDVSYDTSSLEGLNEFSERWAEEHSGETEVVWRVVGFCVLIRRAVIDLIGGLDTRFGIGNFEDDDFCIRAAIAGLSCVTAKDCFVHHFGSRTFEGEAIDRDELLLRNWEVFKKKWGLPEDLGYQAPYDMSWVLQQPFDPRRHYCPVTTDPPVLERWFAAPKWDDPGSWHPIMDEYLRSQSSGDGRLLQLYAGQLCGRDPDSVYELVAQFLQGVGVAPEEAPDIEITAELPSDPPTRVVLTGGPLDEDLRARFPAACTDMDSQRAAA